MLRTYYARIGHGGVRSVVVDMNDGLTRQISRGAVNWGRVDADAKRLAQAILRHFFFVVKGCLQNRTDEYVEHWATRFVNDLVSQRPIGSEWSVDSDKIQQWIDFHSRAVPNKEARRYHGGTTA